MRGLVPGLAGAALALAWGAVVADGALRRARRVASRALDGATADVKVSGEVDAAGRSHAPALPAVVAPVGPSRGSPVLALGAAVRRLQARVASPPSPSPSPSPAVAAPSAGGPPVAAPGGGGMGEAPDAVTVSADRRAGWAALAGLPLAALAPALAGLALAWAVCWPVVAARRRAALVDRRLHDQLPDVVDLLGLTAAAGLPVGAALVAIGGRPGGPVGAALAGAAAHVRHGGATAGALDRLAAAGPAVRPLVEALAQHDRYGTPLVPALDRVAIEARARRRRRSEEAARRLPVTLLLPLVFTTFPAFVLLTVVPLLAGSLGSLSLSPT